MWRYARGLMADAHHQQLLREALTAEAGAHRAVLAGDDERAREAFAEAARRYRASWQAAPPAAFGRLIGMLKASVLAGEGATEAAEYALAELAGGQVADSAAAAYALALAALLTGDDAVAREAAAAMAAGEEAFARTAHALVALADRDARAYAEALGAIVADFEQRTEHLTGVALADTALMLERLAEPRGIAAHPDSPLLPSA